MKVYCNTNSPCELVFLGDSVCVGQHVALHKGWVTRISAALDSLEGQSRRCIVSNASANGRTTRLALEAMPYEIQAHPPDFMILQFGLNDCNIWETDNGLPRVSPGAFRENLKEIIARARNCGVRGIVLNTNHPVGRDSTPLPGSSKTLQDQNKKYNQIIREVATDLAHSVTLVDMEAVYRKHADESGLGLDQLLLPAPDLLHPNEDGHELYYMTILPVILRFMEMDK